MINEKQINAMQERLKKGLLNNIPPMGYVRKFDNKTGESYVEIDEEKSLIVKHIFELYASGEYSLKMIQKFIFDQYNFVISDRTISNMLYNQFYIGINIVKGRSYAHIYPKLIDLELFNKVQEITSSNRKRSLKRINPAYLFQKLLKCNICGCAITCDTKKDKYIYYFCSSKSFGNNKYIDHKIKLFTEKQILSELKTIICDINSDIWELFDKSIFNEKKIIINYLFAELKIDEANISYVLTENNMNVDEIKNYITTNRELIITLKKNKLIKKDFVKPAEFEHILLKLCVAPQSINNLISMTGLSLIEVQSQLIDLQIEDKIKENENGLWETK